MAKVFSLPPRACNGARDADLKCAGLQRRSRRRGRELREIRSFDADKQEIAQLAGVAFAPVLAGPHGCTDWGYAFREPMVARREAEASSGRTRLNVERDASGFFRVV